jgi:hypothetical protein
MGQGHVSCPGGFDRVNIVDHIQGLAAGEAIDDGGDDRRLPRMSE